VLHLVFFQTVSVWDWTTNGETPMCSVVLDDNFGKQVGGERLKKLKLERTFQC